MRGCRLRRTGITFAVLAGSQLGHAIVSYARYGPHAGGLQAGGAHGYLPALAGSVSAVVGVAVMASLLTVAASRALATTPPVRRFRATTRFLDLLPALFAAQVLLFMGQETIESVAAAGHLPSLVELLVWGTFGQLPAAAVTAVAVTWLLARLEAAQIALAGGVATVIGDLPAWAPRRAVGPTGSAALRLAFAFPAAFGKRGPPRCSHP